MKKSKILNSTIALALVTVGGASLAGCGKKKGDGPSTEQLFYSYSVALKSGSSTIQLGKTDKLVVYDNGVDVSGKTHTFESTDEDVATIDSNGVITPVSEGSVNFVAIESSGRRKSLARPVTVVAAPKDANGGYNYSGASDEASLNRRTEILSKLEKYSMDNHLTGITLFDNGGYVKYSKRVKLPTEEYITGYGFGLLGDGSLDPDYPLTGDDGKIKPTYYHSAISQDSLKINQYNATGSQVSDLASYITATYWGTRLDKDDTTKYEWYPQLATDSIYRPILDSNGVLTSYESTKTANNAPIPMEKHNEQGLYKKWRIYVKTDGDVNGSVLKYHTKSSARASFDNRGVTIDDYEFIYKFLLTQSNQLIRGAEMANDTSYGIKGAQRYYNETEKEKNINNIDSKWASLRDNGKLGLKTGTDTNGGYIDIEIINPIDEFTAMYTLSSSLVSPLPKDFFVGPNSIGGSSTEMASSAKKYGAFNSGGDSAIIDYTLSCGPYQLEEWLKRKSIVFSRNDDWFEVGQGRYKIPGVYNAVIDTSNDQDKVWKQFEKGNLDAAGVPTNYVKDQEGNPDVKRTKGDSTFKLNVNSMEKNAWDEKFGKKGYKWNVKSWMSNSAFLDGLFYSIDRPSFAKKRGVTPSINYFSDAYMANPKSGLSYNDTEEHKKAVEGYETIDEETGESDYGYNYDKAVDSFRNAVNQLTAEHKLTLGTRENPTPISIHIRWMYQTDKKEYGEDIAYYFEKAFNDPAVCGGKVKLTVEQEGVSNWEDVYNEWMMKGQFDLAFGAISGNTFNPLNFLEVLKSDNSSGFTLNWGPDTAKVDKVDPIIYDGKAWSFDGLWEVADHGGIVNKGEKIKPVNFCRLNGDELSIVGGGNVELYNGFTATVDVSFAKFDGEGGTAKFDFSRLDISINNQNITLCEGDSFYDAATGKVTFTVTPEKAEEINEKIKQVYGFDKIDDLKPSDYRNNPFLLSKYGEYDLFNFELYYTLTIGEDTTENYTPVKLAF